MIYASLQTTAVFQYRSELMEDVESRVNDELYGINSF